MAWIYFQESGESESHLGRGSEQSHIVRQTDTLRVFYCPERQTEHLTALQSGTTCEHCGVGCYLKLTSSLAVSPVRISALQGLGRVWAESEAAYFSRSLDLPKSADQLSFFLKTSQQLEHEDLTEFYESLPKSGMIVGGRCYRLAVWELLIDESDGSYLPTPTAQSYGSNQSESEGAIVRPSLQTMATMGLWPTPCARDWKDSMTQDAAIGQVEKRDSPVLGLLVKASHPIGQLSPMWVEWLMDYPIGHTALDAWVTQWFQSKREKRLKG